MLQEGSSYGSQASNVAYVHCGGRGGMLLQAGPAPFSESGPSQHTSDVCTLVQLPAGTCEPMHPTWWKNSSNFAALACSCLVAKCLVAKSHAVEFSECAWHYNPSCVTAVLSCGHDSDCLHNVFCVEAWSICICSHFLCKFQVIQLAAHAVELMAYVLHARLEHCWQHSASMPCITLK